MKIERYDSAPGPLELLQIREMKFHDTVLELLDLSERPDAQESLTEAVLLTGPEANLDSPR